MALCILVLFTALAQLIVGSFANTPEESVARIERDATLGGMCFASTVPDEATLRTLRRQVVKFNQRKSMYRDGDIIAVYKLNRPGHSSLAGCADACLLNWRLTDDESQALDTDCSVSDHCPMTSGILVADRKCEAFMFNRITGVCTLLSAKESLKLTRSSNFWSGKLICEDMSSLDDWAQGVVSRRSPPPPSPPSPPPPPPMTQVTWPASAISQYANLDRIDLVFTPPSTLGDVETNMSYNIRCNTKDSGCRPASASDIKNSVTLDCSNLGTCGGSGATSITASLNNAQSTLPITATPSDGYDCYVISMNSFLPTVSDGVCSARLRFVPEAPTAPTGLSVSAGADVYRYPLLLYRCDGTQRIGSTAPSPAEVTDPSTSIAYTFPSSGASDVYYDCYYSAVNQYANGFEPGILRRRFSDFRVTELDLNGVAAVLTSQDLPKGQYHEDDNKTYNSVDAIVEEYKSMFPEYESCGKDLQNFLEQLVENPRKECQPVVLKVTDDKDKRRKFHTMFRNCPFLPSMETHANHPKYDTTANDDSNPDQHTITVMRKRSNKAKGNPGKPIRRAREPWPGGKQYKYVKCVMKKINMDCATALNRISRMLYISPKVLSVAGSKDKRAITSQWITAYQVHPDRLVNVTKALSPQLEFGNFEYCAQTLGLGDLSGNVFEIVLRGISSTEDHVRKAVLCTKANGFINYFGLQRFGTGESPTHHTGQLLLQGKWKEALDCVIRPTSETRSDAREVLMSYINTGNIDEALKRLPRSFHAERTVLEVLKKKGNTEENYPEALLALPKASRNLYIHAFQAYVWNSVLSERIELYGIDTLVEGDLVLPRDQIGELKRKRKREQDVATPSVDGMEPIVVAQDDIDSGKYSIQDIVLPLPGSSVRYPQNSTGSLYEK
eukprot:jgi/Picre1/33968/NNA_001445.t1